MQIYIYIYIFTYKIIYIIVIIVLTIGVFTILHEIYFTLSFQFNYCTDVMTPEKDELFSCLKKYEKSICKWCIR